MHIWVTHVAHNDCKSFHYFEDKKEKGKKKRPRKKTSLFVSSAVFLRPGRRVGVPIWIRACRCCAHLQAVSIEIALQFQNSNHVLTTPDKQANGTWVIILEPGQLKVTTATDFIAQRAFCTDPTIYRPAVTGCHLYTCDLCFDLGLILPSRLFRRRAIKLTDRTHSAAGDCVV